MMRRPSLPPRLQQLAGHPWLTRRTIAIAAAGVIAAAGSLIWFVSQRSNPDDLFQQAMVNMMSLRSYTQKSVTGQDSIIIKADTSDITQPTVSAEIDLRSSKTAVSGYATKNNSLIRFASYGAGGSVDITSIKGKWVQLKKDGKANSGSNGLGFAALFDPSVAVLGSLITGNLATPSRYTLAESIKSEGVYSYNRKKVSDSNVDGQPAMKYDVTINNNAIRQLNQKVATLAGIKQEVSDGVVERKLGSKDLPASIYISPSSQHVLRIEVTTSAGVSATTFSDFDTTQPGSSPTAEIGNSATLNR